MGCVASCNPRPGEDLQGGEWSQCCQHRPQDKGRAAPRRHPVVTRERRTDNRSGDSRFTGICRRIIFKMTQSFCRGERLAVTCVQVSFLCPWWKERAPDFPVWTISQVTSQRSILESCSKSGWAFSPQLACLWTPLTGRGWAQMS